MVSRAGRALLAEFAKTKKRLASFLYSSPLLVWPALKDFEERLRTLSLPDDLDAGQFYSTLLELSSMQIDSAAHRSNKAEIHLGSRWAEEIVQSDGAPQGLRDRAGYNLANALLADHQLELTALRKLPVEEPRLSVVPLQLQSRDTLRRVRVLLASAGHSSSSAPIERSLALCNLGNLLDESGRWVEAYQAYVDALREYPRNGNAAGNAAELLRRKLNTGHGLRGHYAAIYNSYAAMAKGLRADTVAIAGEAAAVRWDELPILATAGHEAHGGDPLDDYQQWISQHRLALSEAVEGLGSDNARWDDAVVKSVAFTPGETDPPPIFAAMNVLKAEYLVARRLAFEGETVLLDDAFDQPDDDTGTYVDTLDMSIYGQPAAKLILAQRAALDILDKIAVVANLHFGTGLKPSVVNFRNYWFERDTGMLRAKLPKAQPPELPGPVMALAELSYDIDKNGLYAHALGLRNAGTHRLVHIRHDEASGVSTEAQNTIDLFELVESCQQTLQVVRSAFLYLIDLVAEGEPDDKSGNLVSFPLPLQD